MSAAPLRRSFVVVLFLGLVAGMLSVAGPASAGVARSMSFRALPSAALPGSTVTVAGMLSDSPTGSPVRIERSTPNGWKLVRTTSTLSPSGYYRAPVVLPSTPRTYSYRAVAPNRGQLRTAASPTIRVLALTPVRATIRKSAATVPAGNTVRVFGTVRPFRSGTTVSIQRRVGTRPWIKLTTARISTRGTWTKTLRPSVTARYRAVVPRRGSLAQGVSGATVITVLPRPQITTVTLPTAAQAFPYSAKLAKTGGNGSWAVVKGFLPFGMGLNPTTGVISGTPTAIETANFTVRFLEKSTRREAVKALRIQVTPSVPPTINTTTLPGATKRVQYSAQLTKTGRDGTWSIASGALPPGLNLSSTTGEISGIPTLRGDGLYEFTVRFTENAGPSDTQPLSIAVALNDPTITTTTLGSATEGKAYTATLAKTGGAGTWTVDSGSLPDGVQLSSAGVLSGTPTVAGNYPFTVRFTESDADGRSATRALSLLVNAPAAPDIQTTTLPDGKVGDAYPATTLTVDGEEGTWSVTEGDLPDGISLNAGTGALTGTPTVAGEFEFTVTFTETVSELSDSQPLSISIEPADPVAPEITTAELADATQGIGYNGQLAVTGTAGTWSIDSGALPPGISLGPVSGNLSGTPTASGEFTFVVRFTQTGNQLSDTQELTLEVIPGVPPVINTASLQEGIRGRDYAATLTKTGDPGTWSVTGLPAGLGVNPATGLISGTPSVSGNFLLTITFTESASTQSATVQLYLHIANSSTVVLQTDALPNGKVGQAYSSTLDSNASVLLDSWSLVSGSLPNGLTLSGSTGTISGTPTVPGTYTFLVRVSSLGVSDERFLRITVNP